MPRQHSLIGFTRKDTAVHKVGVTNPDSHDNGAARAHLESLL